MSKVRVYEYAKEHQVSSKKVIEALKDLGIEVANHMSTINENALRQLDNAIDGTNKKAEAPKKETTSNENGNSKGPNKPNMTNSNEKSNKPNNPAGQANKPATA
ncbi:TPA: translation initiation factor IF-2 N-terminal domain-containing protein, partial [Listeria monocytogenes]|nr:translation initiation factor IF-2 N-terminal domain-containing protein [Listeria monocytogenes]